MTLLNVFQSTNLNLKIFNLLTKKTTKKTKKPKTKVYKLLIHELHINYMHMNRLIAAALVQ